MKTKTFERITIVIINPRLKEKNDDGSNRMPLREGAECDKFANDLQVHTSAEVTIIEHYPQRVLPTEFILLYIDNLNEIDTEFLSRFRKQIIVIDPGADFESLYKYGFAGVVGYRLYLYWQMNRSVFVVPCFLGLTVVAQEMKAKIWRVMGEYCDMTEEETIQTLPVFLLRYLETYQKMVL